MGDDGELQDPDDILTQMEFGLLDFNLFGGDDFSQHHLLTTTRREDDSPCCIDEQVPWTIHHIEKILMKDYDDDDDYEKVVEMEEDQDKLSHLLLLGDTPTPPLLVDQQAECVVSNPESSDPVSDDDGEENNILLLAENKGEPENDPITKKRKRQIRNRDAALRSRERKKLYVRDLEMKSRFLESECNRLQHMLHYYAAENQTLHLHLQQQKNKAFDASKAKQESAVLLLESLLLGSLLWLLGVVCLFSLPGLLLLLIHNPNPCPAGVVVKLGNKNLVVSRALRARNKRRYWGMVWAFFKRRRWRKVEEPKDQIWQYYFSHTLA